MDFDEIFVSFHFYGGRGSLGIKGGLMHRVERSIKSNQHLTR